MEYKLMCITALDTLLGAWVGVSHINYNKEE